MLRKTLYALAAILVLVTVWQIGILHQTYRFLEKQSSAQAYGASESEAELGIVVFMDYACRPCKDSNAAIMQAVSDHAGTRIVVHPLPQPSSEVSMQAARLALAAGEQGQFIAMHDALMRNEKPLTDALAQDLAEQNGLDAAQLQRDAASQEIEEKIVKARNAALRLGINATPSFIVGRKLLYVPQAGDTPYESISNLIQQMRSSS